MKLKRGNSRQSSSFMMLQLSLLYYIVKLEANGLELVFNSPHSVPIYYLKDRLNKTCKIHCSDVFLIIVLHYLISTLSLFFFYFIIFNSGRREVNYPRERMPASNPPISPPQIPPSSSNSSHRKLSNPTKPAIPPEVVEESRFPDGMSVQIFSNGDKVISLPNGQKELHCSEFKVISQCI